jgi:RimJ/RimL family protein N-acetyltransferase
MLQWTTVPHPSTLETAREFATRIIPEGWHTDREWAFAVEAPDDDGTPRFVGTVSLRNEREGRAEIAYGAHPWARGRGYVVRALELLLDWGFREKDLRTVIWWANKGNWASRKVAWRLGFSFDGTVRQWLTQRGELRDAWVGSLLSTDARQPRSRWLEVPRIHVPRIVEACSDETTAHWLTQMPAPYTPAHARDWLEEVREAIATGTGVTWAVAEPARDALLGVVTVFDIDPQGSAEVGYWTHPQARGRGVTTRACSLAVRHAFVPVDDGGLGLRRLRGLAADGNSASVRVLEANGFKETGRARRVKRMRDGTYVDLVHHDLLASEYLPGSLRG